jgi:hypothetical protein
MLRWISMARFGHVKAILQRLLGGGLEMKTYKLLTGIALAGVLVVGAAALARRQRGKSQAKLQS